MVLGKGFAVRRFGEMPDKWHGMGNLGQGRNLMQWQGGGHGAFR